MQVNVGRGLLRFVSRAIVSGGGIPHSLAIFLPSAVSRTLQHVHGPVQMCARHCPTKSPASPGWPLIYPVSLHCVQYDMLTSRVDMNYFTPPQQRLSRTNPPPPPELSVTIYIYILICYTIAIAPHPTTPIDSANAASPLPRPRRLHHPQRIPLPPCTQQASHPPGRFPRMGYPRGDRFGAWCAIHPSTYCIYLNVRLANRLDIQKTATSPAPP